MTVQNQILQPMLRFQQQHWNFRRFGANYLLLLLLTDITLIQCAFWLSMRLRYVLPFGRNLHPDFFLQNLPIPLSALQIAVGVIWLLSFVIASVYSSNHIFHWGEETQRLVLAHTIAAFFLAGALYMARIELMRLVYLYFYVSVLLALLAYRMILRLWQHIRKAQLDAQNVLVIGAGDGLNHIITQLRHQPFPIYNLVGVVDNGQDRVDTTAMDIPLLGSLHQINLGETIRRHNISDVVVVLPRQLHDQMANLIEQIRGLPVQLRIMPDYFDLTFRSATMGRLGDIPVIDLHEAQVDTFQRMVKRMIDIVGAGVGLLLAAPIMITIAIMIKLQDGGPILYCAQRVGEQGRLFTMYKFRSMVVNADRLQNNVNQQDSNGNVIHKQKNDPRVTKLGRFLRRSSLDELPQLFNVLLGNMSLVGPRPELPWLVEQYEPWQYRRLNMPQGITGWWQVNGRSNKLMHLNTEQDLYYVENYSLWLDLQILWRTVSVVLRGKGAY